MTRKGSYSARRLSQKPTVFVERAEDGYRLLVEHDGEIELHEGHAAIATARAKADLLRAELEKQGWRQSDV